MPKAYGYIRVSGEEQAETGLSLEAQEQTARGFWQRTLKETDVEWGTLWADEAVSAFKKPFLRRPSGKKFVTVAEPGDHIIVTRFDRCFRSMLDFVNTFKLLETRGIILHVLDAPGDPNTANGRAMLQMLCVFAEWESRVKGERVKAAQAILRQQGKHTGGMPPWGYKVEGRRRDRDNGIPGDRRLVPDWDERRWMLEVARLRLVERLGCWEDVARAMRRHQLAAIRDGRAKPNGNGQAAPKDECRQRRAAKMSWQAFAHKDPLFRREWSADSCMAAFEGLRRINAKEGGDWITDPVLRVLLLTVGVRA